MDAIEAAAMRAWAEFCRRYGIPETPWTQLTALEQATWRRIAERTLTVTVGESQPSGGKP